MQPWSSSSTTLTEFPSEVCVWIRLLRLPELMYKNSILNAIRNTIGKVVKIDYNTKKLGFALMKNYKGSNMKDYKMFVSSVDVDVCIHKIKHRWSKGSCFGKHHPLLWLETIWVHGVEELGETLANVVLCKLNFGLFMMTPFGMG